MNESENTQKPKPAIPAWFLACLAVAILLWAGSSWYTATESDRTRARNIELADEREANGCDTSSFRGMADDPDC